MADRERVIEGLRKAAEELARYAPMKVNGRCQMYFDEAIYLLKEQETVEPIDLGLSADFITWGCPICERWLEHDYKYCPYCGRKVKWDEG